MGVTVFESVSPTLAHSAYRLYIQESFCANIKNSTHLNSENTTPAPRLSLGEELRTKSENYGD